jgi:hypothetical protein
MGLNQAAGCRQPVRAMFRRRDSLSDNYTATMARSELMLRILNNGPTVSVLLEHFNLEEYFQSQLTLPRADW